MLCNKLIYFTQPIFFSLSVSLINPELVKKKKKTLSLLEGNFQFLKLDVHPIERRMFGLLILIGLRNWKVTKERVQWLFENS